MKKGRLKETTSTLLILQHWRDAVPNDRLAHLIKDATRALLRALNNRLMKHFVPLGHWTFLRILWERDGLSQRELSEQAGVMEPTTFAAMKSMERQGYITRRQLHGNKKSIFIFLTPKGRALKSKLVPLAEDVNKTAVKNIKPNDVAIGRQMLLTIIENLALEESSSSKQRRSATLSRASTSHVRGNRSPLKRKKPLR